MKLKLRIARLEKKASHFISEFAHLTDDELGARIFNLASELHASGDLEPEMAADLIANGLWRTSRSISVSPRLSMNGQEDGVFDEVR